MDQQIYQDNQNEISLKDILRIVRKRKFWLIATFIIVVGAVAGYLYQATPIYQASATLRVSPSQSSSSLESILSLQGGTTSTRISTEVELIKSRRNISKIIEELDLVNYYSRQNGSKGTVNVNSLISSVNSMISVSTVKDTNIVKISVQNKDPNLARNIANTLMYVYNDMLKELAQETFTVRREFIESQIGSTEQQVIDAENRLREFKEQEGIYILDQEALLLLENVTYYEKQIEPYNIQVSEADSKISAYTDLLQENSIQPVPYETVALDPEMRSIRAEMSRAKLELDGFQLSTASESGQQNSRRDELYTRITRLENELNQRILELLFTEREGLGTSTQMVIMELADAYTLKYLAEIDISYLTQLRNKYEAEMVTLPAIEQQLLDLQRDVTVQQNLYILMLEKFEEAKIAEAAVTGTSTVIDEAVTPRSPIKPNKQMMLAIGVLMGLFLGILLIFLVEAFDDAVRDEESIRRALGAELPILGRIPHLLIDENRKYNELVVYNDPTSPPAEAYKLISTNVLYSSVEAPQVICITSAEMAQGKTSIIANAGIAMAQNGYKTLLIDADMRKPRLEKAMGLLRSQSGLVNHLLQGVGLEEIIQEPLPELPNLSILAVGPLPPNPTAILTSDKFQSMLKDLRGQYDRILIDLPPLLAASDALIAARQSDGIVMVVRSGLSSKYGLKIASESIRNSGVPIVGIVINDITREDSYHYYHYYYYYRDTGEKVPKKKRRYKSQYKKSSRKYRKGIQSGSSRRRSSGRGKVVKRRAAVLEVPQQEQVVIRSRSTHPTLETPPVSSPAGKQERTASVEPKSDVSVEPAVRKTQPETPQAAAGIVVPGETPEKQSRSVIPSEEQVSETGVKDIKKSSPKRAPKESVKRSAISKDKDGTGRTVTSRSKSVPKPKASSAKPKPAAKPGSAAAHSSSSRKPKAAPEKPERSNQDKKVKSPFDYISELEQDVLNEHPDNNDKE